jgi:hypothetical protein
VSRDSQDQHEDTAVPREGRILRDAQGKVIFIGDCAPLSFLQTVRHLIASAVDAEEFPVAASRDSIIEVARPPSSDRYHNYGIDRRELSSLIGDYAIATSGLADIFEHDHLLHEVSTWVESVAVASYLDEASSASWYLILAIGAQEGNEQKAEAWSNHARDLLLKNLCGSMNVAAVQGFALLAIYMLRAFQPNGAYLYFSLAARTAYAIGLHRTEVNASFGQPHHFRRDRIWKSLRVIDMLISTILGRPPCTSDVDCTVKYASMEKSGDLGDQVLDASVQIFMIIERIVVEVYSRKRISLKIAAYVSHQLKGWASTWLRVLSNNTKSGSQRRVVVGACSTLCSYYYAIMLLTRPFLIYELYEYMGASLRAPGSKVEHEEKRKYADAALDAATAFVDTLQAVIEDGMMPARMPLVVSWLFTTSLVLAVGVLGRSGLMFEKNCQASISCLEYFAKVDPHARQYSIIVQALLETTTNHVKKREERLQHARKQASAHLFGLLPSTCDHTPSESSVIHNTSANEPPQQQPSSGAGVENNLTVHDWTIYDSDFFAMPWLDETDQGLQGFLQPGRHTLDGGNLVDIPLFPVYDQMRIARPLRNS